MARGRACLSLGKEAVSLSFFFLVFLPFYIKVGLGRTSKKNSSPSLGRAIYAFLFTEFFQNPTHINFVGKKKFQPLRVRPNDAFLEGRERIIEKRGEKGKRVPWTKGVRATHAKKKKRSFLQLETTVSISWLLGLIWDLNLSYIRF